MKKNLRDLAIFFLVGILFIGGIASTILISIPNEGLNPIIVLGIILGTLLLFLGLYYFLVYKPKKRKGR